MLASGERGTHRKAAPFGADGGLCGLSAQPSHRRQIHSSEARKLAKLGFSGRKRTPHRPHHADARRSPSTPRSFPFHKNQDLFAMAP